MRRKQEYCLTPEEEARETRELEEAFMWREEGYAETLNKKEREEDDLFMWERQAQQDEERFLNALPAHERYALEQSERQNLKGVGMPERWNSLAD